MKVGDTTVLSAKNSEGSSAKFAWKSSDDSVATIDENGNLKAAKAEPTQTTKSPFPILGILAGLGIAGVFILRRKL